MMEDACNKNESITVLTHKISRESFSRYMVKRVNADGTKETFFIYPFWIGSFKKNEKSMRISYEHEANGPVTFKTIHKRTTGKLSMYRANYTVCGSVMAHHYEFTYYFPKNVTRLELKEQAGIMDELIKYTITHNFKKLCEMSLYSELAFGDYNGHTVYTKCIGIEVI